MTTSKSPWDVAMVALAAGREAFRDYSHKFSPHKFTQPQLFACLVLKEFERKDYRGVARLLADWSDLRRALGLGCVPHFTTLQKASRRLLKLRHVRPLIARTVRPIHGRRGNVPHAAGDSSGFDAHHASRYFIWRRDNQKQDAERPKRRQRYRRFGKLMVVVDCRSHAILAAVASEGPTPDIDQLGDVMAELPASVRVQRMLLDAGFDSAHNHRLLRDGLGILSVIPPKHGRPPKDPDALPTDRVRRRMKTHFNRRAYRLRGQVETVISMLKRNLGPALRAKSRHGRRRDLRLRVLTHNIALAVLEVFYRAVVWTFMGLTAAWAAIPPGGVGLHGPDDRLVGSPEGWVGLCGANGRMVAIPRGRSEFPTPRAGGTANNLICGRPSVRERRF